MVLSEKLELAGGLGITITIFLLAYHLLGVDTEYSYVFQHSNADLAWKYRFSAFWAGQEGSFLIWKGFIFLMLAITRFTGTGKITQRNRAFCPSEDSFTLYRLCVSASSGAEKSLLDLLPHRFRST